ncbi:MAG: methionyl-tRNA formyltransferase [Brevinematales bacterium]|nr:methionyl-tRNA formyltransferase [Brevinematales bacterium]
MRLVFWGSSGFSVPSLELLSRSHTIAAVVTNPDKPVGRHGELHPTPVKTFAIEHGIPCLQPATLRDGALNTPLAEISPDLSVIVSYGRIIPEDLIYLPKHHSVNLHASLLPKYRGASPIQSALLHGETVTGNTVQFITKELDKGDIILREETLIQPDDTYAALSEKLAAGGAKLLLRAVEGIGNGNVSRTPQDDSLASYCSIIRREDGYIRFADETAGDIMNKFRAYFPWPGIYTDFHDEKSRKLIRVSFTKIGINDKILGAPGTVLKAGKDGLIIGCKENSISVETVKPAGKNEMNAAAFVNGYRPGIGLLF